MAENDQDRDGTSEQAETQSENDAFEQGYDSIFAASESDEAEGTDEEADADGDVETAATDSEEEKATPPTAKELGVDTSTEAGKAQFKALLATWNKWQNRHAAKQAKSTEQPKPEPEARAAETPPPPQSESGSWDPYTVALDKFVPELKFREGSDLADYKDELAELMADSNRQAIQYTLNAMRQNDVTYREMEQVGTAQQQIAQFAKELQAHPDWDEKSADVAEFAQNTRDLAVKNPEKWIRAVEGLTGITRDWRKEPEPQRGQPQRPQKKPLANVSRPTSGNRTTFSPSGKNDMELNDAYEANYRRIFG